VFLFNNSFVSYLQGC